MWNPFKKQKDTKLEGIVLSINGQPVRKCIREDPDVTTVAGYLDDNGNYHSTKEATLMSNANIKRHRTYQKNKSDLINILVKYNSYVSGWELASLAEDIVNNPKALKNFLNTLEDAQ